MFFYWSRSQTIDFTKVIGSEVFICGDQIKADEYKLKKLNDWLRNNKDDWAASFVTYAPGYMYYSKDISINVFSGSVVINYKSKSGYAQVLKDAETTSINGICKNDS